jgi:hypothetical protein
VLLRSSLGHDLEGQMEDEREEIAGCARTSDFRDGVNAFAGKRKPVYRGA